MKKWIAIASVSLCLGFVYALAQAENQGVREPSSIDQPRSDTQQSDTQQMDDFWFDQQPGTADIPQLRNRPSADSKASETQEHGTQTSQTKESHSYSKTCTDNQGATLQPGSKGYDTCMRSQSNRAADKSKNQGQPASKDQS